MTSVTVVGGLAGGGGKGNQGIGRGDQFGEAAAGLGQGGKRVAATGIEDDEAHFCRRTGQRIEQVGKVE